MEEEFKPCPFCGRKVDITDQDTLYPNGFSWEEHPDGYRSYSMGLSGLSANKDQWCYGFNCPEGSGGCGAEINGDTRQEAIDKWNRRA